MDTMKKTIFRVFVRIKHHFSELSGLALSISGYSGFSGSARHPVKSERTIGN